MSQTLVQAEAITKSFAGRVVVDRLSFAVRRGEVFALLGPNGAGKTTVVRMLLGIIRPDAGRIHVSDEHGAALAASGIGYLPEDRGLYRDIPVLRTLVYFGMLRGLSRHDATARAREWLERMGLADRAGERLDALSKGNQQRVQLIASILHRPALAILDEPFSGLDPLSQEFFLELVRGLVREGMTILLSAHQMDLVERAVDRVLLLNRGREILSGPIAELARRLDARPRIRLVLDGDGDAAPFHADPDVADFAVDGREIHITLRDGARPPEFLARAAALAPLTAITMETPRLHDVFVRAVTTDDRNAGDGT